MAARIDPKDLPFDVPKFDEDTFVRKELFSFRTTVTLFGDTLVVAVTTDFVWRYAGLDFFLLAVIAMAFAAAIRPLYRILRIDISHYKRKEWIGTVILFFFCWLSFTLILFNPPFSDNAPPDVQVAVSPAVQGAGFPVWINASINDNRGVDDASVVFCLVSLDGRPVPESYSALSAGEQAACRQPWTNDGHGIWSFVWRDTTAGDYAWFARAADTGGQTNETRGLVSIADPFTVVLPRAGQDAGFDEVTDQLIVDVPKELDILTVQYRINGVDYAMVRETGGPERPLERWFTTPEYPGWTVGQNDVRITAIENVTWFDSARSAGARVQQENLTFTLNVTENVPVAQLSSPVHSERAAPDRQVTPGPGMPLSLLGIGLAAVFVVRRRRR